MERGTAGKGSSPAAGSFGGGEKGIPMNELLCTVFRKRAEGAEPAEKRRTETGGAIGHDERHTRRLPFYAVTAGLLLFLGSALFSASEGILINVPAGRYKPFLDGEEQQTVHAFQLQKYPVTNREFLQFVRQNPEWSMDRKPDLFSDENYLRHWRVNGQNARNSRPVTNVSYFAARAYCESRGLRLPSTLEWEYAAGFRSALAPNESEEAFSRRILDWYGRTGNDLRPVGQGFQNVLGIHDLHGLIWEWTIDFNSATVGGDSRDTKESGLFCGAAATAANDPSLYATFMRYAFRSGLQARYSSKNLGFRCARSL